MNSIVNLTNRLVPLLTHSDFYWSVKKCEDTEEGKQMTVKYKKEKWEDMENKGRGELFLDFSILGHFLHWLLSSTSAHWLTSLLFIFYLQTCMSVCVHLESMEPWTWYVEGGKNITFLATK